MQKIYLYFIFFFSMIYSVPGLTVTKQQAYDACQSCKNNPTNCIGYNNGPYACYDLTQSVTNPSNAFKMSYATGCNQPWSSCPTVNTFTFTGTYPTCPEGVTYNPNTASCPPPACVAGATAPVMAMISHEIAGELDILIGGNNDGSRTTCSGGCTYTYNSNTGRTGNHGSSADGKATFVEYTGTKTGASCTSSDPTASGAPTNPPSPGCVSDVTGKVICANSDPCGTIQGTANSSPTTICPSATDQPECVTVAGFADQVCSGAPKNCGWVNGQYICAEPDSGPAKNPANDKICFINGVYKNCVTGVEGVEQTQSTTSSTANGETITTTTTSDNVIGNQPSTSSTTTNATTGTSTTTSDGVSATAGSGTGSDSKLLGDIAKNTGDSKGLLDQILAGMGTGTATGDIGTEQTGIDATIQGDIDGLASRSTDESSFLSLDLFDVPSTSTCTGVNETKLGLVLDFDPCEKLEPLREMLGWLLYVLLVQFAYSMATRGNAR